MSLEACVCALYNQLYFRNTTGNNIYYIFTKTRDVRGNRRPRREHFKILT